jgi:RNA polymerase sigma-70 factor (ECF subfamily)
VVARADALFDDPAAGAGSHDARVERLYEQHQAFVWRNARRLGSADDWVDDAVQEVFLVAARRLDELTPSSNVRGWLFAITFRVVQRMQRGRARYRSRLQRLGQMHEGAQAPSPDGASDAARQLRRMLAELDDAKRIVLILMELEGMTSAETASIMGVPQGTVDSRLRAARQRLKELLDRDRQREEAGES